MKAMAGLSPRATPESRSRRTMMSKTSNVPALFKALGQQDRIRVLRLFEPEGAELSAKMIAAEMGIPLSNVSYHVKLLREVGLLRTVRSEPRRGAMENYQRVTPAGVAALKLLAAAGA